MNNMDARDRRALRKLGQELRKLMEPDADRVIKTSILQQKPLYQCCQGCPNWKPGAICNCVLPSLESVKY